MNRIAAAALTFLAVGCGIAPGDEFRKGVPTSDAVTMKLPGQASSGLSSEGTRRDGLLGDQAKSYELTRGVTTMVNGGAGVVLGLVRNIIEHPPTTLSATTAVWGPFTDALSPNTYRFTVTKNGADNFSYILEGKGKNEADSAFKAVLSGSHVVTGKDLGSGTFLLDWNTAALLPEHDPKNIGTVQYTYSHTSATAPVKIDTIFTQVKDSDSGQLVDVNYKFQADPGQGGSFEFKMIKDIVPGAALETASVKSRWLETGAGRSDMKISGGDVPAPATANECWDTNFTSRFLSLSYSSTGGWGAESDCSFNTAEYSVVAP